MGGEKSQRNRVAAQKRHAGNARQEIAYPENYAQRDRNHNA